ncbi:MAG: ABC transporter permease [Eubacteriaceae bacterium]|nr:ABC transporter permease [Eubacteriaceae bacterium]
MLSLLTLRIKKLKDDIPLIVIMTLMAFFLTMIFGASMGGNFKPVILIADRDNSLESIEMVNEIKSMPNYTYEVTSFEDAMQKVKEWDAKGAVVIPEGFSKETTKSLTFYAIEDSIEKVQFENSLKSKLQIVGNKMQLVRLGEIVFESKGIAKLENQINSKFDDDWKNRKPLATELTTANRLKVNNYSNLFHYMVGFTLFFSTYVLVFGAADILKEKQDRTFQRLLVSPLSRWAILASNTIVTFMTGFIQVVILVLAGKYILGVDWGEHVGAILLMYGAFVFTVTSFGMFLSGILKTHEQLSAITPVILTGFAMLGGCMWPLEIITSKLLLAIANITPHKWAIQSIEGILMYGKPVSSIMVPLAVLLGMGIFYYAIGVMTIKSE